MATPRGKTNLPVNYTEQLQQEAGAIASRIATPSGDRIRTSGNRSFTTPDGVEGETLEVVIVDFVSNNLYYDSAYNRDNPQPPACFALGLEPALMVPSDKSPAKQAETCSVCPQNQFGSAMIGKGKACKNTRLLAVAPLDEDAPIWILSVPPTSLKSFDAYVNGLSSKHRTVPIGVVTQITLDKKQEYSSLQFNVVRPLVNTELGDYMPRRDEARVRLLAEPDVSGYTPPNQGGKSRINQARAR